MVRKIGLSGFTELDDDKETKEVMSTWNGSCQVMTALQKSVLEHKLYVYKQWHSALIIPPLPISDEQVEEGFELLVDVLEETDKAAGGGTVPYSGADKKYTGLRGKLCRASSLNLL